MGWRARIILIVFWVASFVAVPMWGRAQTPSGQKPAGFEDLRGRAREATFENGRYRQAGITFNLPADWTYGGTMAGETPADETAHWTEPRTGIAFSAWLSKRKTAPENVAILLENVVAHKTRQRERERFQRWHVRSESVQHTSVGGHQAVVAIADFELEGIENAEARVSDLDLYV